MPGIILSYGCHIHHYFCSSGVTIIEFSRTGYDSRFSVYKRKLNDCMKAISLKPAGTAQNFRILAVFSQFLTNFGLHIATISTIMCYVATIFDADIIASLAAFAALIGIYPQTKFEKGGEKI
jgi:hypothetical protein